MTQPRVKTYSAESGAVYQYRFAAHHADAEGDRYSFAVTRDRQRVPDVMVFLPRASLDAWEGRNARVFTPTERYALAKIALFSAWDAAEEPAGGEHLIEVDAKEVNRIADMLDL